MVDTPEPRHGLVEIAVSRPAPRPELVAGRGPRHEIDRVRRWRHERDVKLGDERTERVRDLGRPFDADFTRCPDPVRELLADRNVRRDGVGDELLEQADRRSLLVAGYDLRPAGELRNGG